MIYQYLPVDRITYGVNIVNEQLLQEVQRLHGERILLVTTNSILSTKAYQNMKESLQSSGIALFETCSKQHVPGNILMRDIHAIREFSPNLIISCGGGSPIDAAKILSFVLADDVKTEESLYLYSDNVGAKSIAMKNYIPHISIPTTLSASEFTSIAGVTNGEDHLKYKFSHLNMTPKVVFLDPAFTVETPEWLWISTGIRAVDHAVETLYSPTPNPINTGLALQALKKLYYYLPQSKAEPENLRARLECQIGAWLSLFSVVNIKLGLSHSIGHQLGARFNIPHGMTSAIMLPHVMKFLLSRTYNEQAQIPEVLGKVDIKMSVKDKATIAPGLIKDLIEKLEIPHRLRDFNVSREQLLPLVTNVLKDIQGEENSFVLQTEDLREEITSLLEAAY
ncbi:iron-containing alcohol dehydrogenase [Desertibacillus haloalkaliphilus]|uniref:iron-containing alcohol dehydrogenase n=1 Tax=Desertibacillus haloalkaliphilus TaxID=1328930 RepID=UPI001C278433|nr:iron-containing alcohol dehydrogenase [Desertibacillus haloalkaliphilus]MBU8906247.1 iron-containing alcohol dehydrogenase [Desertibacillus haloalkaliphilus]